jgi:hypothetical protein
MELVSITETLPPSKFVTYRRRPSGLTAMSTRGGIAQGDRPSEQPPLVSVDGGGPARSGSPESRWRRGGGRPGWVGPRLGARRYGLARRREPDGFDFELGQLGAQPAGQPRDILRVQFRIRLEFKPYVHQLADVRIVVVAAHRTPITPVLHPNGRIIHPSTRARG